MSVCCVCDCLLCVSVSQGDGEGIPSSHKRQKEGSGRSVVGGNCTLLQSFGAGQEARVTPAFVVSSHCSFRETSLLACSLARSFTLSLLEQRRVLSVGEDVPTLNEVLRKDRFVCEFLLMVTLCSFLAVMIDVLQCLSQKKKSHRALELFPLLGDLMRDYHVFCDKSPKFVPVEILLAKCSFRCRRHTLRISSVQAAGPRELHELQLCPCRCFVLPARPSSS